MTVMVRFLQKVNIAPNGNCWNWKAEHNHLGYSRFTNQGKHMMAHRFIYKYYYGEIDSKLVLDHLCRNRECRECNKINCCTKYYKQKMELMA